jgi:regulator of protease activity HflC (stomatin/prohibitin superfamily)
VGTYTLDELLENKESIAKAVLEEVKEEAINLGVEVFNTGIRDVILPGDMKEIMNQVLVAQKKAQANVITRREETASTRSLLNTAKLMEDNDMLFKLKEMEYVEKIADKIGEISISGNGGVVKQLKDIFSVNK